MKIENPIGWCDETINAVTGCEKVSPGCKNCYAEIGSRARILRSQGIETWGVNGVRFPVNFEAVFEKMNRYCICERCRTGMPSRFCGDPTASCRCGSAELRRIRLFADSNSDWLDRKWPYATLGRFLQAIRLSPNVDVLLLTKRIELWRERLNEVVLLWDDSSPEASDTRNWLKDWFENSIAPQNVWLGVSAETQEIAEERVPQLLKIPAAVTFVSAEPLLEPIRFDRLSADDSLGVYFNAFTGHGTWNKDFQCQPLDWVIVGGESGTNRRDCGVEAITGVARSCVEARVPVYVKQDCAFKSGRQNRIPDDIWMLKQFPMVW